MGGGGDENLSPQLTLPGPKTPKTTVIDASAIEALRTQLAALSQSVGGG